MTLRDQNGLVLDEGDMVAMAHSDFVPVWRVSKVHTGLGAEGTIEAIPHLELMSGVVKIAQPNGVLAGVVKLARTLEEPKLTLAAAEEAKPDAKKA